MPLTTRCGRCGRLFPVYAQQLRRRKGKVHCPQCGGRFDAVSGLIDEVIPGGDLEDTLPSTLKRYQEITPAQASPMMFEEPPARPGMAGTFAWTLGVLVLLVGLAAQLFWWERGIWLRYPRVQQLYDRICTEIEICPPLPRMAGTMEVLQPILSEHPLDDSVLRLDLTLINHSEQLQRPPILQLELYNDDAGLIAARRFAPSEYLPPDRPLSALSAGSATNVAMEISSPREAPSSFRVQLF